MSHDLSRRTALKLLGASAATVGSANVVAARPKKGRIRKLGQTILEPSTVERDENGNIVGGGPHFAEESIRADGQYAVVGTYLGEIGSFLVDISNPRDPTEVHRVASPSYGTRHADVKFDHRNGLYYRSLEGENTGVEVIDYGFGDGTPSEPEILTRIDAGSTHNVESHPEADVLYTTEHDGVGVWDTSDPTDVTSGEVASPDPAGDCHDMVVDTERDLLHCAFIGGGFDGYVAMDISDPLSPTVAGKFSYEGLPDYSEERLENGEPGFSSCHYARHDPNRDLVVVGDELGFGYPGGKHIFDIGWGDGSVAEPEHIGFTYSPNAKVMDELPDLFDWTTHNHDVIPKGETTLLVSGDYHEGAVVYDITDPTDPTPTDAYETDDMEEEAGETLDFIGDAPMAWGVDYAAERDFTVLSDMVTGLYVFKFTPSASGGGGGRGGR